MPCLVDHCEIGELVEREYVSPACAITSAVGVTFLYIHMILTVALNSFYFVALYCTLSLQARRLSYAF
jgi:hypothetical protein